MSAGNGHPGDASEFLPYAMGQSAVGGIQHVLGGGLRLIADHPWLAAAGGPAWNILAAMPQSRQAMGSVGDSALDAGAANQWEALRGRGMAGRFAVNAAGAAPELAAVIASGPYAPMTAAGIAGADKYGEMRGERGLSPDESLKSAGINAGMNAVIGMIPGLKGLAGPEYESFLRSLGRQGAIGGAMGEAQGVANTAQNAVEFGDPVEPEQWARDIGNRWGIDSRTVQLTENFLRDAAGGIPGGIAGGSLRRYWVGGAEPRPGIEGIEAHEGEPQHVTLQGGVGREAPTELSPGALIFDKQGNAHIRLSDGKLLDSIDTATTQREDGGGYAVVHPQSGHVLAEGVTPEQAEMRAEEGARKLGRRRLQKRLDEEGHTPDSNAPSVGLSEIDQQQKPLNSSPAESQAAHPKETPRLQEASRQKGDRMRSSDNPHQQLEEIEKAQRSVRQGGSGQIIDSIKKSEQRAKHARKPHNIDLDDFE